MLQQKKFYVRLLLHILTLLGTLSFFSLGTFVRKGKGENFGSVNSHDSYGILPLTLCTTDDLLRADTLSVAYTLPCAPWLFLQRWVFAHLPHWRVVCGGWRGECVVLPCDSLLCPWLERSTYVLLECVDVCRLWDCGVGGWTGYGGIV